MKTKQRNKALILVCLVGLIMSSAPRCFATENPAAIVVDAVLVRPACLVSTILGGAFFVICLPVAATSKSVHETAKALVVKPAVATFTRPLGDFEDLSAD